MVRRATEITEDCCETMLQIVTTKVVDIRHYH
jgi:hypothetical protein